MCRDIHVQQEQAHGDHLACSDAFNQIHSFPTNGLPSKTALAELIIDGKFMIYVPIKAIAKPC